MVKGYQEFGQDKEKDLIAARDELHVMQGKAKVWLNEFNKIHMTMSRKPLFLPSFSACESVFALNLSFDSTSYRRTFPPLQRLCRYCCYQISAEES